MHADLRIEPLALELPGHPLGTSWAYLIEGEDGTVHLIDSGVDTDGNFQRLEVALAARGRSVTDIATVTLTHLHYDHAGMARRIRAASGASVGLHREDVEVMRAGRTYGGEGLLQRLELWGVPRDRHAELADALGRPVAASGPFEVDRLLEDGDRIPVPGFELEVLHTPGHTRGHICVLNRPAGTAFVGDHVIAGLNPGIGLGGAGQAVALADYLESLDRLQSSGVGILRPGHGEIIDHVPGRLAAIRGHHRRRSEQVQEAAERAAGVWDVAAAISWSAGWDNLAGTHLYFALSQVAMHLSSMGVR